MAEAVGLALAFLEARPDSAARSLESLDPEDAAALIELVPVRIAAPALAQMTSWSAAQCLSEVPADRAGSILDQLRSRDALAILRQMPASARDAVLAVLPESLARHYRRTLAYPASRVGAWIDHDIAVLEHERTVGDALDLLRARRRPDDTVILLMDQGRRYRGAVPVSGLLHFDRGAGLAAAATLQLHGIADSASLLSVSGDPSWASSLVLPVSNRHGELLGGLRRVNLEKGLTAEWRAERRNGDTPVLLHLMEAYLVVVGGLARVPEPTDDQPRPENPAGTFRAR